MPLANGDRAGLLGLLLGAAACGSAPEGPAVAVRDSSGVRIAESAAPRSATAPWRTGEVLLDVGGEGTGTEIGEVAGALRLSDGRIVVADAGTAEVRWLSRLGEPLRSAGGRGDGPGEFRLITEIGATEGDSVWVYDFTHRRVTWLAPDGTMAGSVSLRPPLGSGGVVGRLSSGGFVAAESWSAPRVAAVQEPGLDRRPAAYVRYAPDGALLDTIGLFPGREVMLRLEGRRAVMGVAPFARASSHLLTDADELVVGDQVGYELSVYDARGRRLRVLRWDGGDLALGAGEVDAWETRQLEAAPSDERAAVRAHLDQTPTPASRPAYGSLVAGPDRQIWVGAYAHPGEEPARWDVFDAGGAWLGTVAMPERFRPLRAGAGWVLGVARDATDVEHLVLHELLPG